MKHILTKTFLAFFIPILFIFNLGKLYSQETDPFIQSMVDALDYDSVYTKLQAFQNLGIKGVGTEALDQTADWIIGQYQAWGYTDIAIDSFNLNQNLVYNIIVTKTGTVHPDTYLIIDGHYDTYNGPGTNDNGSGTSIVLELARMLANVDTKYSIRFIHFTAEELGLIGSSHYVENTVLPENMDIRLVLNIDEVGGVAGMVNNTVTCERDEWAPMGNNAASAAFTDTLATLTEMYSELNTNISYAYGSDYVPFMNNGYVVTGLYEYNESPYPHSINDSLSNLDPEYVYQITKAGLAASLYFSNYIDTNTGIERQLKADNKIVVGPNPFRSVLWIDNGFEESCLIRIIDANGKLRCTSEIKPCSLIALQPEIEPGLYLLVITTARGDLLDSEKLVKN